MPMTSTPKPNRAPLSEAEYQTLNRMETTIWAMVHFDARTQRATLKYGHFAKFAIEVATLKASGLWKRRYLSKEAAFSFVPSWRAYCAAELPFPRRYMDRQCHVAEVYTALTVATFGKPEYAMLKPAEIAWLPTHEKHCEALALFPPDEWVGIWERVKATDRRITEALIKAMGQSVAGFYDAHRNAQEPHSAFSGVVGYTPT